MSLERKKSWLFLEWIGTVLFGAMPDVRPINRFIARAFYFFMNHHKFPNLSTARHFNEKLINFKTSDEARDALRTRVTDKEFVKDFVAQKIGPGHVVPTLAVLRSPAEVDAYEFPLPCVVKPTHSSQEVMLLEDHQPTDKERRRLKYWLWKNYFAASREPNYKDLEKKLIVESVVGGKFGAVEDIKVMCFFGKPKLIHVDRGRYQDHHRDYFDVKGRPLPVELKYEAAGLPFPFPEKLPEMMSICEKLAAGFGFIRVDFYVCDGAILVGELTSFPSNCVFPFRPPEADLRIARALDEPDFEITPELFADLPPLRRASEKPGAAPRAEAGERVVAFPMAEAAMAARPRAAAEAPRRLKRFGVG
ncbi:MAG: ATP-grasp fold amidoligase family protein, partial [Parvularculaceae bacterium]